MLSHDMIVVRFRRTHGLVQALIDIVRIPIS